MYYYRAVFISEISLTTQFFVNMAQQVFLSKVGEKLGDVESVVAPPPTAASAASAAPQAPPEINSILDAAKCGASPLFASHDVLMTADTAEKHDQTRAVCTLRKAGGALLHCLRCQMPRRGQRTTEHSHAQRIHMRTLADARINEIGMGWDGFLSLHKCRGATCRRCCAGRILDRCPSQKGWDGATCVIYSKARGNGSSLLR